MTKKRKSRSKRAAVLLLVLAEVGGCGPGSSADGGVDSSSGANSEGSTTQPASSNTTEPQSSSDVSGSGDTSTTDAGDMSSDTTACTPEDIVGECSLVCRDCGDGQKCTLGGPTPDSGEWDHTVCVPISPDPVPAGEPCENDAESYADACQEGDVCTFTNEGSVCAQICLASVAELNCAEPSTRCVPYPIDVETDYGNCLPPCDPLLPCDSLFGDLFLCELVSASCDLEGNESCYPLGADATTVCGDPAQNPNPPEHGYHCEWQSQCDVGLMCAPAAFIADCGAPVGCCTELCDLGAENPDAACSAYDLGERCLQLFAIGEEPPGIPNIGLCRLP